MISRNILNPEMDKQCTCNFTFKRHLIIQSNANIPKYELFDVFHEFPRIHEQKRYFKQDNEIGYM